MRKLAILGVTGSIGTQVLEVLKSRNDYELVAVSCNKNISLLENILKRNKTIKYVFVRDKIESKKLEKKYENIIFFSEENGLVDLVRFCCCDVFVNAILGFDGLLPSLEIIKNNKILLLANKESLVIGGAIINKFLKKYKKAKLIPIDSEHVAISKCLLNKNKNKISELIITASGGKFFDKTKDELKNIKKSDAISHPNWNMGKKITIDSNTMMNKTFELIEAYYLFNVNFKKIKAIVNKESFVHGIIKFDDETLLQVSKPTMLEPIEFALNYYKENIKKYDDVEINTFEKYKFYDLNEERFSLLKYAKLAVKYEGNYGCALNAADEEAANAFFENKIMFYQIEDVIDKVMKDFKFRRTNSIQNILKTDFEVRELARKVIEEL